MEGRKMETINDGLTRTFVALATWRTAVTDRLPDDERGEGVISAAIAVLVFAVLGGLMYVGFQAIWGDVEQGVSNEVSTITNGG